MAEAEAPIAFSIAHPGHHNTSDTNYIQDTFGKAVVKTFCGRLALGRLATYDSVFERAYEWALTPEGRGCAGSRRWRIATHLPLASAQEALITLEQAKAARSVWSSPGKRGRPPTKETKLCDEIAAHEVRLCEIGREMQNREEMMLRATEGGDALAPSVAWALASGRRHYVHLLGQLQHRYAELGCLLRKATGQLKRARRREDHEQVRLHCVAKQNPDTVGLTMQTALDNVATREQAGDAIGPFRAQQIYEAVDRLKTFAVMTLAEIYADIGRPKAVCDAEAVDQLVTTLPVFAIDVQLKNGNCLAENRYIFNLRHRDASTVIAQFLQSAELGYRSHRRSVVDGTESPLPLADSSSSEDEDESDAGEPAATDGVVARRGRKRVEEKYGMDVVTFIENYAHTRGDVRTQDKALMREDKDRRTYSYFDQPL